MWKYEEFDMDKYKIINKETKELIVKEVLLADQFWSRLKGLLGRDSLGDGEGLLLTPCNAIHCFGMKFAIDAVFLDKDMRVIHIVDNLKPKLRASHRNAKYVLELKSGIAQSKGLRVGDILEMEDN